VLAFPSLRAVEKRSAPLLLALSERLKLFGAFLPDFGPSTACAFGAATT